MWINVCIQQNHTVFTTISWNAGVIFCYRTHHTIIWSSSSAKGNKSQEALVAHLSYCLLSVLSLCSHKYYKGDFRHDLKFMWYLLQQRWRATKRGQQCTSPFPSSSFTSTAEPSSATDPFSSQMPACMKWKPVCKLLQLLLFHHDTVNVSAVWPIISPVCWQFPGMLSWCYSGQMAYGIPTCSGHYS